MVQSPDSGVVRQHAVVGKRGQQPVDSGRCHAGLVGQVRQGRTIIVRNDAEEIETAIQNLDGGRRRVFAGLASPLSLQ